MTPRARRQQSQVQSAVRLWRRHRWHWRLNTQIFDHVEPDLKLTGKRLKGKIGNLKQDRLDPSEKYPVEYHEGNSRMVFETQRIDKSASFERDVATARNQLLSVRDVLGQWIIGQDDVLDLSLICLVAQGHVLLEGTPGLGKTLLIKTIAQSTTLDMRRVQFTPDLMPSDILGGERLAEVDGGIVTQFERGPIFTNILLADEINRANQGLRRSTRSNGRGHVTVAGDTTHLPNPFFVFASQNPVDMREPIHCQKLKWTAS